MAKKQQASAKSSAEGARGGGKLSLELRLIKGLAHPLRVKILELMNAREYSPREIERELGEGLSQVSYHVKVLKDFELIEMTKTQPRRGAVEHYYRAVERAHLPSDMSKDMPKPAQEVVGDSILGKIDEDVSASLKSGKFYARDDWHVSWTPADLDDEGCREAERLADKFIEEFLKIEAASANRRAAGEGDGEHIWTSAALVVFGSECGGKDIASKQKGSKRKRRSKK